MKYKTLAALKAAYDSGELDPSCPLVLDNDYCSVYTEAGECVYQGPGYELREEALTLLGIPWELC